MPCCRFQRMRSHLDLLVDLQQVRLTCCCAAIRRGHAQSACPACCKLCPLQQVKLGNTSRAAAHAAMLRSVQQPAWQALPAQCLAECSPPATADMYLPPAAATSTPALRLLRACSAGVLLTVPRHRCDPCSALLTACDEVHACNVLIRANLLGTKVCMA